MTRKIAKEILKNLNEKYISSEDEDDIEIGWALEFAIADMETLQDVLDCTKGVVEE